MKHRFMAFLTSAALSLSCLTPVYAGAEDSLPGDLNCDQQISSADAVLLCRLLAEDADDLLTKQGIQNADYNYDGIIDMADQRAVLSYIQKPDEQYTVKMYVPRYTARPGETLDVGVFLYDNTGYIKSTVTIKADRNLQISTEKNGRTAVQGGILNGNDISYSAGVPTADGIFSVSVISSGAIIQENGLLFMLRMTVPDDAKPHTFYPIDIAYSELSSIDPDDGSLYKLKCKAICGGIDVLPTFDATTAPQTEPSKTTISHTITTDSTAKTTTSAPQITTMTTTKSETSKAATTLTTISTTAERTTISPIQTEPTGPVYTQVDSLQIAPYPFIVRRNEEVTLHVIGIPNTEYDINVYYSSGASKATGLENHVSDSAGHVSWTWKIGGKTNSGNYSIDLIGGNVKTKIQFSVVD